MTGVSFFFWGGGSSECNDMAFTSAIFSEARHVRPWSWWSKHTTKAMDIPGADAQNGGRMGGFRGFACLAKVGGVFFGLMVLPVEMKVYRVGKLFLGWIFGSTARQHGALGKSLKYLLRNCPMMPLGFWPFAFLRAGFNWPHLLINWEQWISHLRSNECIQEFMPVASNPWSWNEVISYQMLSVTTSCNDLSIAFQGVFFRDL